MLEAWKAFEEANGTEADVAKVQGMMPIVGRKQHVDKETGQVVEGEPFYFSSWSVWLMFLPDWELVFADDEREVNPASFKFLQMAHAWKNSQAKKGGGSTLLSGFVAASKPDASWNDPERSSSRSQDVTMREREADDGGSDVASSDGE